jgi:glyoxylase-like metal-dependent hydrolase (beta-lactamase superfamily II)
MNFRLTRATPHRNLVAATALIVVSVGWACGQAFAQVDSPVIKINAEAAQADITVEPLRGNISVLIGSGGNIAVLNGDEGKLMVDAGIAVSQPKLSATLDGISPAPLQYLINTHWHWDHTDGNKWVHESGATIIAHESTLKHLSETIRVDD